MKTMQTMMMAGDRGPYNQLIARILCWLLFVFFFFFESDISLLVDGWMILSPALRRSNTMGLLLYYSSTTTTTTSCKIPTAVLLSAGGDGRRISTARILPLRERRIMRNNIGDDHHLLLAASRTRKSYTSSSSLQMVESFNMDNMMKSDTNNNEDVVDDTIDHDKVGMGLAGSVQRWLDSEWMPQKIHEEIGLSCYRSYVNCRTNNEGDLMTIMTTIATDLEKDWIQLYDKDAFVNAWDVSNYASDYLVSKCAGFEERACQCSSKIY